MEGVNKSRGGCVMLTCNGSKDVPNIIKAVTDLINSNLLEDQWFVGLKNY